MQSFDPTLCPDIVLTKELEKKIIIGILTCRMESRLAHWHEINYVLLVSRQGKIRLSKWIALLSAKEKQRIVKEVVLAVLARRSKMCNVLEHKDHKVIYRRYASLFFVAGVAQDTNELLVLEIIHRFVEVLDRYFGNVCELDLIFNFSKAYNILDELMIAGELQESSRKAVLRVVTQQDALADGDEPAEKH